MLASNILMYCIRKPKTRRVRHIQLSYTYSITVIPATYFSIIYNVLSITIQTMCITSTLVMLSSDSTTSVMSYISEA